MKCSYKTGVVCEHPEQRMRTCAVLRKHSDCPEGILPDCDERTPEGYCKFDIVGHDKCINLLGTIGCMEDLL